MLIKIGNLQDISSQDIQTQESVFADLDETKMNAKFKKLADQLKRVAPKANDFLYFTTVMMHSAEAALVNPDGTVKTGKDGKPVTSKWDINEKTGSWKWNCSDSSIKPYKNSNGDLFPEIELLKAYKNWNEKPLCVDHKSDQVDAVRGIILDTWYDRTHKRVIALCALDQKSFPELANGIKTGYKTCVSMGVRVAKAVCTDCGQVAAVERDFCHHMRNKVGYGEINIGLDPIELSIVVNGADPQAKIRTILAHANQIRANLEKSANSNTESLKNLDEKLSKMIDEVNSGVLSKLHDIRATVAEIESDLDKEMSDKPSDSSKVDDVATDPKLPESTPSDSDKESSMSEALQFPTRLANNNTLKLSDLQELKESINSKFIDLEKGLVTLSHKIKEEIMSVNSKESLNKEAYLQGGGGVNEPTPHARKYPVDPGNEKARNSEDKQLNVIESGADGLFPGDEEKKKLVQRAELEERSLRRAGALAKAKENVAKAKTAYWNGTTEPTPGKKQYAVDPLNEKARNSEDKQLNVVETGSDGLFPGDEEKKKLIQRAAKLSGKFVRVAAEDGSEDRAASGWEVSRGGEPLFTVTVDELSQGNVDAMYDTIEAKAYGLNVLKTVQKLGYEKAKAFFKGAQSQGRHPRQVDPQTCMNIQMFLNRTMPGTSQIAVDGSWGPETIQKMHEWAKINLPSCPTEQVFDQVKGYASKEVKASFKGAQMAPAAAPAAAPMPELAPSEDVSGDPAIGDEHLSGDTREVAFKLATEIRDRASDLLEAIRAITDDKSEMGELEEIGNKAASTDFSKLVSMKKEAASQLVSSLKVVVGELNSAGEELELGANILTDEPKPAHVAVVSESIADAKQVLDSAYEHMDAVVAYYKGSKELTKKAGMVESQLHEENKVEDMANVSDELDSLSVDELLEMAAEKAKSEGDHDLAKEIKLVVEEADSDLDEDLNEVATPVTPSASTTTPAPAPAAAAGSTPAAPVDAHQNVTAGCDLTTREGRAMARAKLAAETIKWNPVLEEAHKLVDHDLKGIKTDSNGEHIETVEENHKAILEVAEAPVKIRREAARLNELIKAKKIAVADLDALVARGADADVVKYWKDFYGQAGSEGSEFATELLKEHAKAQLDEQMLAYKTKLSRAYELTNEMVRRGMLADERSTIASYVDEVMTWNDEAFSSMKRVVAKTAASKTSSFPQVGLISTASSDAPAPVASLQEQIDLVFSGRRF